MRLSYLEAAVGNAVGTWCTGAMVDGQSGSPEM